jgi:hypothetical protein
MFSGFLGLIRRTISCNKGTLSVIDSKLSMYEYSLSKGGHPPLTRMMTFLERKRDYAADFPCCAMRMDAPGVDGGEEGRTRQVTGDWEYQAGRRVGRNRETANPKPFTEWLPKPGGMKG